MPRLQVGLQRHARPGQSRPIVVGRKLLQVGKGAVDDVDAVIAADGTVAQQRDHKPVDQRPRGDAESVGTAAVQSLWFAYHAEPPGKPERGERRHQSRGRVMAAPSLTPHSSVDDLVRRPAQAEAKKMAMIATRLDRLIEQAERTNDLLQRLLANRGGR